MNFYDQADRLAKSLLDHLPPEVTRYMNRQPGRDALEQLEADREFFENSSARGDAVTAALFLLEAEYHHRKRHEASEVVLNRARKYAKWAGAL